MTWLGKRLGYETPEDWYDVRYQDFSANGGQRLMVAYHHSPCLAVMDLMPEYPWKEWFFRRVPHGFWNEAENLHRWFDWFEEQVQVSKTEDWYGLKSRDVKRHRGGGVVLRFFGNSIGQMAAFRYPDHDWFEWCFEQVPKGFWSIRGNRRRYAEWLAERLGIKSDDDWYQVTRKKMVDNRGGGILHFYNLSPSAFIRDTVLAADTREWAFERGPNHFWEERKNRRRFLKWLAGQLGLKGERELWKIRLVDIRRHHGGTLAFMYRGSVRKLLADSLGEEHPAVIKYGALRGRPRVKSKEPGRRARSDR